MPPGYAHGIPPGCEAGLPLVPCQGSQAGGVRERYRGHIGSEHADDQAREPELALFRVFQVVADLLDALAGLAEYLPGFIEFRGLGVAGFGTLRGGAVPVQVMACCQGLAFAQLAFDVFQFSCQLAFLPGRRDERDFA